MADRVVLDHVCLTKDGPTLALRLTSGQCLAVVGRAGSGKSKFLSLLSEDEAPVRGSVAISGSVAAHWHAEIPRRVKPQALASGPGAGGNERAAQALSATGLWDQRQTPVGELSPGLRYASALLPALVCRNEIVLIDGLLDGLDPWTLGACLDLIRRRMNEAQTFCLATNRPDIAAQADVLVVLDRAHVRFAGTPADLLRSATMSRLEIHAASAPAVRALARPFEITFSEENGVIHIEAAEAQELAARMVLEGYGEVKFVVLSQPTVESALRSLV